MLYESISLMSPAKSRSFRKFREALNMPWVSVGFVLGFLAWFSGAGWVAVIALCIVAALIAFLIFNLYL